MVKPLAFVTRGPKGLVQPALKCRGREYLRIIYGPEYTAADQLPRLRSRGLAGETIPGRSGICAGIGSSGTLRRARTAAPGSRMRFGVLALESEPVDPRL